MQRCCFWIRENLSLVVGLLIPVLLIVVFGLSAAIPAMLVAKPRYDLIFTANDYQETSVERRFKVVDSKVKVELRQGKSRFSTQPKLYRYEARSGEIRPIDFDIPTSKGDSEDWRVFTISSLKNIHIDSNEEAPDGYRAVHFDKDHKGTFLFFGDMRRNQLVLTNSGRTLRITAPDASDSWSFKDVRPLGWVIPEEQPHE